MAYLIRTAIQGRAVTDGLERVLAQTQPSDAVLFEIQKALRGERRSRHSCGLAATGPGGTSCSTPSSAARCRLRMWAC